MIWMEWEIELIKNGKLVSFIFVYKIAALTHFIFCWKILSTGY